jgi:hypothetical protein
MFDIYILGLLIKTIIELLNPVTGHIEVYVGIAGIIIIICFFFFDMMMSINTGFFFFYITIGIRN